MLALKAPNTTKAEFANTVDPDETAHNEFILKVFLNFVDVILSSAFLAFYELT